MFENAVNESLEKSGGRDRIFNNFLEMKQQILFQTKTNAVHRGKCPIIIAPCDRRACDDDCDCGAPCWTDSGADADDDASAAAADDAEADVR